MVAARAAVRARQAAARAQEAAEEAGDDLRQIAATEAPLPRPGWVEGIRRKLEARAAFAHGKERYEERDLAGARPHLERAVRLDPEHDEARALLAWLEYFTGKPDGAIVTFKTALRRQPTWEGLYNGLGWSRLRLAAWPTLSPQIPRLIFAW